MTITTSSTGADEEWCRIVVAKNGRAVILLVCEKTHWTSHLPQSIWYVGDVNHCARSQSVSVLNLEVVAVTPFSCGAIAVVGIVGNR